MTILLRVLVIIAATEALVIAFVYLAFTSWRARGRVGWFLALLGGSLAWMLTLAVVGWWVRPPLTLWAIGLAVLDTALGLQLQLVLRRHVRKAEEAPDEPTESAGAVREGDHGTRRDRIRALQRRDDGRHPRGRGGHS